MPRPSSTSRPLSPVEGEYRSDVPAESREAQEAAQRMERIGYGAHHEAAQAASDPEPEAHDVGKGRVLTDTVTKFDGRTGGMPLVFKAGTAVDSLPRWAAEDVMTNDALHAEGPKG